MKLQPRLIAALVLLLSATALAVVSSVSVDPAVARRQAEAQKTIASRQRHIDCAELLGLIHNNQVKLVIIDVRDQADYNLFHLTDARRVGMDELNASWLRQLPPDSIKVIVSNDERRAEAASFQLMAAGIPGVYMLEKGINNWLAIYGHRHIAGGTDDTLRCEFSMALGSRDPAARPDLGLAPKREFTAKVKFARPLGKVGGGCGG